MTKEQAMQLLSQLAANYRGTLEEHQNLQNALKVVSDLVTKEVTEEE